MNNLIGKILTGTIAGEDATFEITATKEILGDAFLILDCVEFGAPLIKISVFDINQPVRA